MKKNKIMRFASLILVLTLLSTCAISGTFAKYTTTKTASDSARVAKWGVTLTVSNGSNFAANYGYDTENVVDSDNSNFAVLSAGFADKLVAPGTSSGADGITFTMAGRPEVATKIDIDMTVTSDVFVKSTGADAYTPVKFTLVQTADYNGQPVEQPLVAGGTLTDVEKKLEEYAATAYYKADSNLACSFKLTWAWAFDTTEPVGANDANDTLLGNLAAGTVTGYTEGMPNPSESDKYVRNYTDNTYCDDINFNVTFTVTQVD